MKKILFAIAILMSIQASAQTVPGKPAKYEISKDAKTGFLVFKGPLSFDDLQKEPSFTWLAKGHNEYKPDQASMDYLNAYLQEYDMVVVLGTWCEDSHNMIPKLERVLEETHTTGKAVLYGADREKQTGNGENKQYGVTLLPTVILMKNGKEVGRVTETVKESIETDLARIIAKDKAPADR